MASSRSSGPSRSRPERLGCEVPRVFTPPLRKLTPKTSAGFALIEFAEGVLDMELLPWQKWLAIHALELLPDGTFRFRTVVLLVARQNGKSTFLQVLALFFLYVRGVALVIGTAQNLDIAEEVWQGAVDIAQDVPDLAAEIERVTMVNGKKALELRGRERYKVQAANRRGGRGLSGDLVMLDELREHQTWAAWAAVTKTTMARVLAQVWAASNAGDATSVVLHFLRVLAHLSLGDPDALRLGAVVPDEIDEVDDDSLGIFEWSAPPGCATNDRDGWAQANPSLGHTITERAIASALRTDPEAVFRTEVLCQWVDHIDPPVVDPAIWQAITDPQSQVKTLAGFGFDVSPGSESAAINAAGVRADTHAHLEMVDHKPGTDWCLAKLVALWVKWQVPIVLDPANPGARAFVEPLEAAGVKVVQVKSHEYAHACQHFVTEVTALRVRHQGWPELAVALAAAKKRDIGDGGWGWARKKATADISPLVAATLALHGLSTVVPVNVTDNVW